MLPSSMCIWRELRRHEEDSGAYLHEDMVQSLELLVGEFGGLLVR